MKVRVCPTAIGPEEDVLKTLSPPMTDEDAVIADGDMTDHDPLAETGGNRAGTLDLIRRREVGLRGKGRFPGRPRPPADEPVAAQAQRDRHARPPEHHHALVEAEQLPFPRSKTIAVRMGVEVRTVQRTLATLKGAGLREGASDVARRGRT